ncbi:sulfate transporter, partial [Trifolium medium]|nr:sulfate transporter [Trifolium medium]
ERFDYARVLIATSSLEVLNVVDTLLVDGVLCEVKMLEERGFNIGEDACLFEEAQEV